MNDTVAAPDPASLGGYKKFYTYRRLAVHAYRLACIGPLAVLLMATAWSVTDPKDVPPVVIRSIWWTLALSSPTGTLLGAIALYNIRIRYRDDHPAAAAHARSAVVVGVMASLFVLIMTWQLAEDRRLYRNAHGPTCMSNLQQLSLAELQYAQDYDEHFALPTTWNESIYPYAKNSELLRCPAVPSDEKRPTYAMNRRLGGATMDAITLPEQTVHIFNSEAGHDLAGGMELLPHPSRHNGYDSIAFVDGHVKYRTEQEILGLIWSLTTQPKRRPVPGG